MNNTIKELYKQNIKDGLAKCTEAQQLLFKRMYSHKNLELAIDKVVDNMPDEKLDMALTQVEATLNKALH
jgi:hypothetical protein